MDQRVLPIGLLGSSGRGVQVAERDHVLGCRVPRDDVRVSVDRLLEVPARPRHLREAGERRDVVRVRVHAARVRARGGGEVALVEVQLPQLIAGPRGVRRRAGDVARGLHRLDRAGHVAHQLAGVRDAGVRSDTRPGVHHGLERGERVAVPAELDLRVADHAVDVAVVRVDGLRLLSPPQRAGEVVPGGGERGHAHHGREVVIPLQPERASEHALRLRVVAGVGRDARLLHVREAERCERLPVGGQHPQP